MSGIGIWQLIIISFLLVVPLVLGLLIMGRQLGVEVRHKESGLPSKIFLGYSWTYLLFGWLVALIRGEILVALLHLIFSTVTLGIFQIVMSFLYNRQHANRKLNAGWVIYDTPAMAALAEERLGLK